MYVATGMCVGQYPAQGVPRLMSQVYHLRDDLELKSATLLAEK